MFKVLQHGSIMRYRFININIRTLPQPFHIYPELGGWPFTNDSRANASGALHPWQTKAKTSVWRWNLFVKLKFKALTLRAARRRTHCCTWSGSWLRTSADSTLTLASPITLRLDRDFYAFATSEHEWNERSRHWIKVYLCRVLLTLSRIRRSMVALMWYSDYILPQNYDIICLMNFPEHPC